MVVLSRLRLFWDCRGLGVHELALVYVTIEQIMEKALWLDQEGRDDYAFHPSPERYHQNESGCHC